MLKKTRRKRGPLFSEGSYRLWIALGKKPIEWMRGELGNPGKNVINRYLYGDQRPNLEIGHRIFLRFGIDPKLFFKAPGAKAKAFLIPGAALSPLGAVRRKKAA